MSFRSAGFRPAALGGVIALVFALSASAAVAQNAKPATRAPATAAGAKQSSPAGTPAVTSTAPAPANNGQRAAATPTAAASAAQPAAPAEATAVAKAGDATAGQGKAAACGACHGMDGNSSDAQYPKLAGQNEAYIVRQLTHFKAGQRQNPIMMGMAAPLSEQDMHDLGAYFSSKQSLPGVADAALVQQGETLFRQGDVERGIPACMACHSIDGRGNPGAAYPQLTSQHAQYIEKTLKSWHDGTTWGNDAQAKIMPSIAKKLDDKDIAALASYVEGLHVNDAAGPAKPATP
ncbi:c-type cytochrome [Frateuria terrea]|uniref:Cytochrome c553 n=1 Tax=Frateuria terrea TaxID=529704 RepID=A0A1H6SKM1_9GAMM|nr:c-type cytochrome [Frateuria terrea]SEI64042.1 Cytochrome c553 [Frateuria terrea]SFP24383.1 Cytochrome c553 [Frateuria terrea]